MDTRWYPKHVPNKEKKVYLEVNLFINIKCIISVSYTHLDVYKRQRRDEEDARTKRTPGRMDRNQRTPRRDRRDERRTLQQTSKKKIRALIKKVYPFKRKMCIRDRCNTNKTYTTQRHHNEHLEKFTNIQT